MRHGATVKRCSIEGCTNQVIKGGVCMRHGTLHKQNDESTAFASCLGSEFEKTTATSPNQRNPPATMMNQGSLPKEVVICGVIADNY